MSAPVNTSHHGVMVQKKGLGVLPSPRDWLGSIERQLESLLKHRELIDKFNSVPPFVPTV